MDGWVLAVPIFSCCWYYTLENVSSRRRTNFSFFLFLIFLLFIVCPSDREFRCGSGQCLYESEVCDNTTDCSDGSDESDMYCGEWSVCLSMHVCMTQAEW